MIVIPCEKFLLIFLQDIFPVKSSKQNDDFDPLISFIGIQLTHGGEIQYSTVLPDWCRLSSKLKSMLEKLLARLFETNHDHLMKHEDFFSEIEKILCLIPIYYLNFKRLTLTCTYLPAEYFVDQLLEQIQQENNDDTDVDYYCLFQK